MRSVFPLWYDIIHALLTENWLNKLANLNEWIERSRFFTSRSRKTTANLLSLPSPFILYSSKLLNSNSAWLYIPRCVFPSKDSTSFFYSLSSSSSLFFIWARSTSFRSKWYLMCKEERQWINNQSSPSLCPKANGFSLLSLRRGSFIVYKKHR